MLTASLIKYLEIAKVQIKLTLRTNLLFAVLITAFTPVIFGIKNLDAVASSYVLERFVALIGIILFIPIFLPEQDKNIAELAESKYTPPTGIYLTRLLLAVVSLFLLIGGFVFIMLSLSCEFNAFKYIIGTFATGFFLGALGFGVYSFSDNIVAGYIVPLSYYMINMFYAGDKLKNLYLFSLTQNNFTEKKWLLCFGAVIIFSGIAYRYAVQKTR